MRTPCFTNDHSGTDHNNRLGDHDHRSNHNDASYDDYRGTNHNNRYCDHNRTNNDRSTNHNDRGEDHRMSK